MPPAFAQTAKFGLIFSFCHFNYRFVIYFILNVSSVNNNDSSSFYFLILSCADCAIYTRGLNKLRFFSLSTSRLLSLYYNQAQINFFLGLFGAQFLRLF